jgi:hypothetical protein
MGSNPVVGRERGAVGAIWTCIAADSLMSVLDVLKYTQQVFNSRDRQGRGTDGVGIKCQVGGLNRYEAFDMGL